MRVDKLTADGHQLIQSSSHERACDIENHLARLSEAWSQIDHKAETRYAFIRRKPSYFLDACERLYMLLITAFLPDYMKNFFSFTVVTINLVSHC